MRNRKHIKGDTAELIAAQYFIDSGCYVFKNISQQGPADLVVLNLNGGVDLYDVKAFSIRDKNGWKVNRSLSDLQKKCNVKFLYVDLVNKKVLDYLPEKKKYEKKIVDMKKYKIEKIMMWE